MKLNNLKKIFVSLIAVFTLSAVGTIFHAPTKEVEAQTQSTGFYMMEGASIRAMNTKSADGVDQNGIRFQTVITEEKYLEIENSIPEGGKVTFYTLVSDEISVEDLTYGKEDYKATWGWNGGFDGKSEYSRFTELYNFPESMFRTIFTARSCYIVTDSEGKQVGDVVYASGKDVSRSMEGVAIEHLTQNAENAAEMKKYGGYLGLEVDEGQTASDLFQTEETPIYYGKNRLSKDTQAVTNIDGFSGELKIYSKAKQIGKTNEKGELVVANEDLNEETVYAVTDGRGVYKTTAKAIDYLLGDASEFVAWALAVRDMTDKTSTTPTYTMLTDNIDLTGEVFVNTRWDTYTGTRHQNDGFGYGYLCGEFDGQGFTVDGLEHYRTGWFAGVAKGGYTFKNVAFTNIALSKVDNTARYIFGSLINGKFAFENVYLQITAVGAATETSEISIVNDCGMLSIKNCVVDFAFTYKEGAPAYTKAFIFRNRNPQGVKNFFAIGSAPLSAIDGGDTLNTKVNSSDVFTNYGRYPTFEDYISEGLELSSAYPTTCWDTEENVFLFKTARQYIHSSYEDLVTPPTVRAFGDGKEVAVLSAGQTYTLASSMSNVAFELKETVSGVRIEGNQITLSEAVEDGTEITIKVVYTHPMYEAITHEGEKTYSVVVQRSVRVGEQIVGLNRTTGLILSLAPYGEFTSAKVDLLSVDGVAESGKIKNGYLVVDSDCFEGYAGETVTVIAQIGSLELTIPVKTVHFAIGTTAELNGFRLLALRNDDNNDPTYNTFGEANPFDVNNDSKTAQTYVYAVLTDNVSAKDIAAWNVNAYFHGELDGQGYTISGITTGPSALGIFWGLKDATIKNISFVDVTNPRNNGATALFAYNSTKISSGNVLSNVYVQGVLTNTNTSNSNYGLLQTTDNFASIENVVVDVEFGCSGCYAVDSTGSWLSSNKKIVKNVLAISSTAKGFAPWTPSNNCKWVTSVDGVTMSAFDEAYWDMTKGYPVWNRLPKKATLPNYGGLHIYQKTSVTGAYLVTGGTTEYKLVAKDTTSQAVKDFRSLWKEATGTTITVLSQSSVTSANNGKYIFLGCDTIESSVNLGLNEELPSGKTMNSQGFRIRTVDNDIYVSSATETGVTFGAYELLSQLFGYERYGVDLYTISATSELAMQLFDIADNPDFEMRIGTFGSVYSEEEVSNTMQFVTPASVYVGSERYHNTLKYLPKETYQSAHSKWYSNNGDQLCYTAHGDLSEYNAMVMAMVNACTAVLEGNTTGRVMTITPMDNNKFCTCSACQVEKGLYGGNLSGSIWKFHLDVVRGINAWLDENQPGRKENLLLCTFAYLSYQAAPAYKTSDGVWHAYEGMDARYDEEVSNAAIFYAMSSADYLHGLNDPIYNGNVHTAAAGWKACTNHAGVWLYQTNFKDYLIPTGGFEYQDNYKLCLDFGAKWIFDQGQHNNNNTTGFNNFKLYLNSKLQWNVNLSVAELTANYFAAAYGEAAGKMKAYYDSISAHMQTLPPSEIEVNMTSEENFPEAKVREWLALVEEAKALLEEGSPEYDRVCLDGLSAEYLYLKYYAAGDMTSSELSSARTAFISTAKALGVTRCDQTTLIGNLVW